MDNQSLTGYDSEIRVFLILLAILFFFLIGSLLFNSSNRRSDPTLSEIASEAFPDVSLTAKSAYVYDARTKTVLYAKDENTRLSLASLTKVMSSLVAEEAGPLFSVIYINDESLKLEGDGGLYKDERWSLKNILDFSLLTSSNDGIYAVALALGALSRSDATSEEIINSFVGAMNSKASELGLKNTYYLNVTGLDESDEKGGAYGTAKDMNTLLEYVLVNRPELLEATRDTKNTFFSLDNQTHTAKNTNIIASEIPGLIASKTGYTETAGGNLVFIFDPELGRPIIVSILGSTASGRFEDAQILIDAVMEYIKSN